MEINRSNLWLDNSNSKNSVGGFGWGSTEMVMVVAAVYRSSGADETQMVAGG